MKFLYTLLAIIFSAGFIRSQISVNATVKHIEPEIENSKGSILLEVSGGTEPYTYYWRQLDVSDRDIFDLDKGLYTTNVTDDLSEVVQKDYDLGYKIKWFNLLSLEQNQDALIKTGGDWGTALSRNILESYTDGWGEQVIASLGEQDEILGFLPGNAAPSNYFDDIIYGFHIRNSDLYTIINGNFEYIGACSVGDVIKIERVGNVINFYLNSVLVNSIEESGISDYELKLKVALSLNGQTVKNVGCSFKPRPCTLEANAGSNQVISCNTYTVDLSGGSSASNAAYSWSPGGSNPISATTRTSAAGIYTLTVTDLDNGCVASSTVAVTTNTTLPNVSAGSNQTITCSTPTVVLTGSSTTSGVTYSWTPGGSAPTNTATSVSAKGTYTLKVTNPTNGCVNSGTVLVVGNLAIASTVTNYENSDLPGAINLCVVGGTPPYSFAWNGAKMWSNHDYYQDLIDNNGTLTVDTLTLYPKLDSLRQKKSFTGLLSGIYYTKVYDSVNNEFALTSIVGNKVDWITSPSIQPTVENAYKTTSENGDVIYYGESTNLRNSDEVNAYAVSEYVINVSDASNYVSFIMPEISYSAAIGFKAATNTNYNNMEDMMPKTVVSIVNDALMIYFNSNLVYSGDNIPGKELSILLNAESKTIEYYIAGTLIYSIADEGLNIFGKDLQLKALVGPGMTLGSVVLAGPVKPKRSINGVATDVTCGTSSSGMISFNSYSLYNDDLLCNYTLTGPNGYSSSGNIISGGANIYGLTAGIYNLTVPVYNASGGCGSSPYTSMVATYTIAYMPDWINQQPTSPAGATYVSPTDKSFNVTVTQASPYTWLCGASSENVLSKFDNGWAAFSPKLQTTPFSISWPSAIAFGLSDVDQNTLPSNIDHRFYVKRAPVGSVFGPYGSGIVNGPYVTSVMSGGIVLNTLTYTWPTDILKINKTALGGGSSMKFDFYRNSILLGSNTVSSTDLICDISVNQRTSIVSKPRLSFGCRMNYQYGIVKPKLDAGYYFAYDGKLYFKYDEEYQDVDSRLNFNIYNNQNVLIYSSATPVIPLSSLAGDNRYFLDFSASTPIGAGFYILEVINEKNEKWYLRFKK